MLNNSVQIISSFSPILVVVYLAWKEYKSGNSGLSKKITEDYKERNGQLEVERKEINDKLQEHSIEIAKLQATLNEKDKQLKDYKEIFANRNPELISVLSEIREFMRSINAQNQYQTKILEKREVRDKAIDEASANQDGAPMMAPVDPIN